MLACNGRNLFQAFGGGAGQFVAAFIKRVPIMAADPMPMYFYRVRQFVQLHPQVLILDRFFVRCAPIVFLPILYPGLHSVFYILAVGVQFYFVVSARRSQCANYRRQFHAVVGCVRFAPAAFCDVFIICCNKCPSARARV